ncbi:hypothetical protein O3W44_03620 [Pantoea sp. LMR881]|uniref:hypothetical protein n=1 Tax=Pantoea sp. LMR881 TaxID=3014336 RepID=UPI0022AFF96C|nr:hypothetical protein [Pantoea sp. LMR881]MCZ4058368.1 hypothetical protein [Pantoea sp. LMR881]
MTITQRRAKCILLLACLVLTLCVLQRAVTSSVATQQIVTAPVDQHFSGDSSCALSAKSLPGHAPLFDLPFPFLLLLLTFVRSALPLRLHTTQACLHQAPPRRRHLTFCVFRL